MGASVVKPAVALTVGATSLAVKPLIFAGKQVARKSKRSYLKGTMGDARGEAAFTVMDALNSPIVNEFGAVSEWFASDVSNTPHFTLFRKLNSKSLNELAQPIDSALLNKLDKKGWKIEIAKPGTDDWKWLNMNNAIVVFYNRQRRHSYLGCKSPEQFELICNL